MRPSTCVSLSKNEPELLLYQLEIIETYIYECLIRPSKHTYRNDDYPTTLVQYDSIGVSAFQKSNIQALPRKGRSTDYLAPFTTKGLESPVKKTSRYHLKLLLTGASLQPRCISVTEGRRRPRIERLYDREHHTLDEKRLTWTLELRFYQRYHYQGPLQSSRTSLFNYTIVKITRVTVRPEAKFKRGDTIKRSHILIIKFGAVPKGELEVIAPVQNNDLPLLSPGTNRWFYEIQAKRQWTDYYSLREVFETSLKDGQ